MKATTLNQILRIIDSTVQELISVRDGASSPELRYSASYAATILAVLESEIKQVKP